jgi:acid stress-induced BolA-like protein IbaG/YrbA
MVQPNDIENYIRQGLDCSYLQVEGDGHHFEAVIVSASFEGLRLVTRHQKVYEVLGDRMRQEIHALSMKTLTPQEWSDQSSQPSS